MSDEMTTPELPVDRPVVSAPPAPPAERADPAPATTPATPAMPSQNGGGAQQSAPMPGALAYAQAAAGAHAAPASQAAPVVHATPVAPASPPPAITPAAAPAATETAAAAQPSASGVAVAERPAEGAIGDPSVTGGRENQPGTNQSVSTWNMDPVIEMVDVHKAFGSFRVLDGVTFRIPRGGVTFLMGPSGTGKSVSLRHIVGLLMPDSGDVFVEGQNVPKLTEKEVLELRRKVGMLFQDGALFSSMNLYDNVAFPLRQHTKFSEGKVRDIVMQRLSEVGLAGAEKRLPNELSGGMRKRAGFARALVMEPKIILVDEPDSGLDPVRTTLLCDLIKQIAKKYDATVIVISHNIEAVRRTADFIGILYKGKMRHFGTRDEIEASPDEFVHQFFNAEPEGPLGMD